MSAPTTQPSDLHPAEVEEEAPPSKQERPRTMRALGSQRPEEQSRLFDMVASMLTGATPTD